MTQEALFRDAFVLPDGPGHSNGHFHETENPAPADVEAQQGRYHGGLVFHGTPDGAIDRFGLIVAGTMEDYGHIVERRSVLNAGEARVLTSQYIVKLTLDTAPYRGRILAHERMSDMPAKPMHRLAISLMPVAPGEEDCDITELLLVVMLYRMVDAYPAQQIEWKDADTILGIEQFLGAFASVSPRRVNSRRTLLGPKSNRFTPVEVMEPGLSQQADWIEAETDTEAEVIHFGGLAPLSDEESLALVFRDDPETDLVEPATPEAAAENDIRRLAAWGMTGMLAFLSGPVALSMAAVNLTRGEDFRLNTHVLALTGFVASISGSGLLANAMSQLAI